MNHTDIQKRLRGDLGPDDIFTVARSVAYFYQHPETDKANALDLIIRLIERRDEFSSLLPGIGDMIDAIAREAGLYPYIQGRGSWTDELAIEAMRAPGMENIIFHIEQAIVFQKLAQGRSIILSAPTSFGKSLLIDAFIAHRQPSTVVAVVPTIALLDEFRRRMQRKFPDYDVITQSSQVRRGDLAVYIGTQERLLERADIEDIDLFVIDEFYKLDLDRNDQRSLALNTILAKYGTKAKQIYFLGPSIDDVPNIERFRSDLEFHKTRYSPVTADIIDRSAERATPARLIADLKDVPGESSLIYVRSPRAAWTMAYELLDNNIFGASSFCSDFGEWLGTNYHPEWVLAKSLGQGIAIHHGRVPRAVAHMMISLFNSEEIGAIVCTSSMIEGVNTAAQNVFVYDRHISINKLDRFTFDNIKGRAGRMFRHNIGRVYLYNAPPEDTEFLVKVPLFESDDRIVPELLVQLDDGYLTPFARQRKRAITDASSLPISVLKAWAEFGVAQLNSLGEELADELRDSASLLYWKGIPDFDQVEATFEAVWGKLKFPHHDIRSARQIAYFANILRRNGNIRGFMDDLVKANGLEAQAEIDKCFNFLRGAEYTFPQVLRALNDVIDSIAGEGAVDYRVYANKLQNLFLPGDLRALDEYGVPMPIATKLRDIDSDDFSLAVDEIRRPGSPVVRDLTTFERAIVYRGLSLD